MRQKTDLCLEELKRELVKPTTSYPRCLIVDEIGVLLIIGDDRDPDEAEKILAELLESELEEDRFLAFCYLSGPAKDYLEEETLAKLKEFEKKKENQEIIQMAQPQINRFRQEFAQIYN